MKYCESRRQVQREINPLNVKKNYLFSERRESTFFSSSVASLFHILFNVRQCISSVINDFFTIFSPCGHRTDNSEALTLTRCERAAPTLWFWSLL